MLSYLSAPGTLTLSYLSTPGTVMLSYLSALGTVTLSYLSASGTVFGHDRCGSFCGAVLSVCGSVCGTVHQNGSVFFKLDVSKLVSSSDARNRFFKISVRFRFGFLKKKLGFGLE